MPLVNFAVLTCLLAGAATSASNHNAPLDRSLTLRLNDPFVLENEHARLIRTGSSLGFTFPRPCISPRDSSNICEDDFGWAYSGTGESIRVGPVVGAEAGTGTADRFAGELGGMAAGSKGPVSFFLDTRIFSEAGNRSDGSSFDREDVDHHSEASSGAVAYTGFGRFRGDMSLDLPYCRLTAARDAVHWGPGLYGNLMFQQDAVPFFHYTLRTELGPFTVTSLYGDLTIDDKQMSARNLESRNLYAHRFEYRASPNLLLGFSEQLILYQQNKPYFFLPIVPLFLAKGFIYEDIDNGNLSFDAAYRFTDRVLLYGEFLLDDLESPSSLFTKDYVQNKWGLMAGMHAIKDFSWAETGAIMEYSRIEPWVYTHFKPYTSQAANVGYPLGNQLGPNSQMLIGKIYARRGRNAYAAITTSAVWKGTDLGSGINDAPPDLLSEKEFLGGSVRPVLSVSPFLGYSFRFVHVESEITFGDQTGGYVRLVFTI
jgi:hypothetical protein